MDTQLSSRSHPVIGPIAILLAPVPLYGDMSTTLRIRSAILPTAALHLS
jgi:hypothetical protein